MKHRIEHHPLFGKTLFWDNSVIEIGVPLEFGLRICHFSFCGEKNVFFEQPRELTQFSTPEGWHIRGGHRLWLAPEGEYDYYPDNQPIAYAFEGDTLVLTQENDPLLQGVKSFRISMDGAVLTVTHSFTNTGAAPKECSLWAISALAPGGVETIPFARREDGFDPWHRISTWDYTNLGDPRASYSLDGIRLTYLPIDDRYKIGVGHPDGPVSYENGDITLIQNFPIFRDRAYPDGNVCYETYYGRYFIEMESLSPLRRLLPGESMEHTEQLQLIRK